MFGNVVVIELMFSNRVLLPCAVVRYYYTLLDNFFPSVDETSMLELFAQ